MQITGLVIALLYGAIILWLYVRQPRSFEELKTQAAIEANVYRINQENFDQALKHFNANQHQVALEQFKLADPAGQDPATQFYIAYSYYLLGRGNIYDDDELFKKGMEAINRCLAHAPNNIFEIARTDLEIRNATVLQQRLKEGLESSASDFNPLNWFKK